MSDVTVNLTSLYQQLQPSTSSNTGKKRKAQTIKDNGVNKLAKGDILLSNGNAEMELIDKNKPVTAIVVEKIKSIGNGGKQDKVRKSKAKKDPNMPKKNVSAYIWFTNDKRDHVRKMNPDMKFGDIGKELGRLWAQADQQTKKIYQDLAEKDKRRFQDEFKAYQEKFTASN